MKKIPNEIKHKWVRSSRAGGRHGKGGFSLGFIAWVCLECGDWTANLPLYRHEVCHKKDRRKAKDDRRRPRRLPDLGRHGVLG